MFVMKYALILLVVLAVGYIALMGWRIRNYVKSARAVRKTTQPYFKSGTTSHHLLVLGDSTMYGAGIVDPANTIGGLLSAQYHGSSVETLAVNGARVRDLKTQFSRAQENHYQLIFMGIGGNDVVLLSNYQQLEIELRQFLDMVSAKADKIILTHCVNVGNIGFFVPPLSYLFDYRTRKLSQLYSKITADYPSVSYVSFYRPRNNDYYTKKTRQKFIAADGFHPSDYANQYFFELAHGDKQSPTSKSRG